jgi:hypothetical protein
MFERYSDQKHDFYFYLLIQETEGHVPIEHLSKIK